MKIVKLSGDCRAHYVQIWKIRAGFFTAPWAAMLVFGAKRFGSEGWMVSIGPLQVSYYRYTEV